MGLLLDVKNLTASLRTEGDLVKIVDGVDLTINEGETIGLVGETGAGKTVTARAILGILQLIGEAKPLWKVEGEVFFKGKDLMKLSEEEMREIRGKQIAMITQNPIASLHPMDMIGYQTGETLDEYQMAKIEKITQLVVEHLGKVEISDAQKRSRDFRHQFSGGEGQRILLAMALIRSPSLLIADEPTSALDVTVQRQILELLKAMKEHFDLAMLLITHNLGVIAEMSDYVNVMYSGKIVERGDVKTIFHEPLHPFTTGLLATIPRIDQDFFKFEGIPGEPPNPLYPISGCKFHPRCKYAKNVCSREAPELVEIDPNHFVRCLRIDAIQNLQRS
ncbi:MAG: ABC transporter ATP-binding protein [Candidatus Bathyarchaeota archaeon]|jgi:peptide/nickel transport system ATP-binding protein|nr:ABC transporter ATP-binding protein [Candidatus Bathyarchaeota archaeon]